MPSPPTLCHVVHSLEVGGAEILVDRLARGMQGRFRVVLACLDALGNLGEELRGAGFRIEILNRRPGVDPRCASRLAAFLRREEVDILHAHQYTPFFYSVCAGIVGCKRPIVFTEHGRDFPDGPRPKRMLFNRVMLRQRHRVIGVGESVRQALIHYEGFPKDRVQVVYNGVDLDRFRQAPEARSALRQELGLSKDSFLILQVARLDPLKDHGTALRTLSRIVSENPEIHLVLAGDGPERQGIMEEARARGLDSSVHLLGTRKDVHRLLSAADLFLLTSVSEGIPVTVIEAMAANLPVVATDVGGLPEVVRHRKSGLLVSSGDDAALASAILELRRTPEQRTAFGAEGFKRAHALFSEKEMLKAYRSCYEGLLRE